MSNAIVIFSAVRGAGCGCLGSVTARLRLAAWVVSVGLLLGGAPSLWAFGIGSITVNSSMNEPLDARIELRGLSRDDATGALVGLASEEQFKKAGVELAGTASFLRFRLAYAKGSTPYIKVVTLDPVKQSFVRFLVEVQAGGARSIKQFTILLDPPGLPGLAPLAYDGRSAGAAGSGAAPTTGPGGYQGASAGAGRYGPVKPKETLWNIASITRPSTDISVQQMMAAILKANPEAFDGGRVDRLRKGAILTIPSVTEIAAAKPVDSRVLSRRSSAPASSRPAARPAASADSSPVRSSTPVAAAPAVTDEQASRSVPRTALERRLAELQKELAREQNAAADLEVEGVASGAVPGVEPEAAPEAAPETEPEVDSGANAGTNSKADTGLAASQPSTDGAEPGALVIPADLQEQAAVRPPGLPEQKPVVIAPTPANGAESALGSGLEAGLNGGSSVVGGIDRLDTAVPRSDPSPTSPSPTSPAVGVDDASRAAAGSEKPAVKKPASTSPKVKPRRVVVVAPPAAPKGFGDELLDDTLADPMLMGSAGLGVLGLFSLLGFGVRRRRRLKEEAEVMALMQEADLDSVDEGDLAQVDTLLASGDPQTAETVIRTALASDPSNAQALSKLVDVYAATGNAEGLRGLARDAQARGEAADSELMRKIMAAAGTVESKAASETGSFQADAGATTVMAGAAGVAAAAAVGAVSAEDSSDFDLDADELPDVLDLADLGLDDDALSMPEMAAGGEDSGALADIGLDFDLDDSGFDAAEGAAAATPASDDLGLGDLGSELGGDLGGDLGDGLGDDLSDGLGAGLGLDLGEGSDDLSGLKGGAGSAGDESGDLDADLSADLGLDFSADSGLDLPLSESESADSGSQSADDFGDFDLGGLELGDGEAISDEGVVSMSSKPDAQDDDLSLPGLDLSDASSGDDGLPDLDMSDLKLDTNMSLSDAAAAVAGGADLNAVAGGDEDLLADLGGLGDEFGDGLADGLGEGLGDELAAGNDGLDLGASDDLGGLGELGSLGDLEGLDEEPIGSAGLADGAAGGADDGLEDFSLDFGSEMSLDDASEDLNADEPLAAVFDAPASDATELGEEFSLDFGDTDSDAGAAVAVEDAVSAADDQGLNFTLPDDEAGDASDLDFSGFDEGAGLDSGSDELSSLGGADLDLSSDAPGEGEEGPFGDTVILDGLQFDDGESAADDLGLNDLEGSGNEVDTKLDLARAYIDMGDSDWARNMLDEVIQEGSEGQRQEAERLKADLI